MLTRGELALERPLGLDDEDEDGRLWRSAAGGDRDAFGVLVERHRRRVASVAARLLEDPDEVADAVQETFVRAWEHRRRFDGKGSVRAWLVAVTLNVCRNQRRGYWRRRLFLSRDAPGLAAGPEDPSSLAEDRLERGRLERSVRHLPESLRVPFVLRFFEELSGAEIAAVLGCRESTVWTRIYAARRELQRRLGEDGPESRKAK